MEKSAQNVFNWCRRNDKSEIKEKHQSMKCHLNVDARREMEEEKDDSCNSSTCHWMRVCFTTTTFSACSFVRFQIVIFIDWNTFSRRCTRNEWQRQWFYYLSNAKISQNARNAEVFLLISGTDTVDWRQWRCLTLMAMKCALIVVMRAMLSLARSSSK